MYLIDPIGGIAGDMFIAAAVQLEPQLAVEIDRQIKAIPMLSSLELKFKKVTRCAISAMQFDFDLPGAPRFPVRKYTDIIDLFKHLQLSAAAEEHATSILKIIGEAEAKVHNVALEEVHFHELANWDMVVDVAAAGIIIASLGRENWFCRALPLGGGTVITEHGLMPVPAPATLELLQGMPFYSDTGSMERITPTGAGILRYLDVGFQLPLYVGVITASGSGAGQREMQGIPNILRLNRFERQEQYSPLPDAVSIETISIIEFFIDDQSSEDIELSVELLMDGNDVFDVLRTASIGKKGRLGTSLSVLCKQEAAHAIAIECLSQFSTIGVRVRDETRLVLDREITDEAGMLAKVTTRPDGSKTAKVEAESLRKLRMPYGRRKSIKQQVEDRLERREGGLVQT